MKNNTHMGDKNILFIAFLNKKHKLFKHEQQETHLDTKNEKTNTLMRPQKCCVIVSMLT
jgi:hypothetical protein